ncbi:hypothetical protein HK101_001477 [Irineochytrium annulatum]|nr:hypothetical protein HK101_001477 [Irineochytrium annulatum]
MLAGSDSPQAVDTNLGSLSLEDQPSSHGETLLELLENNRKWADRLRSENPGLLERLSMKQEPEILWIGCSDSRVPAENVVGLGPGDLFVHRNIANVVHNTDFSMLSVIQYAVDVLKVKHIIVCGHYQCGGCAAAMSKKQFGLIDNWLRNIKDVYNSNKNVLAEIEDEQERLDVLVELNVAKSVHNVCHTTVVQNAWARGQYLSVHGWSYRLSDGHIRDLELCINNNEEIDSIYSYVVNEGIKKAYRDRSSSRERGENQMTALSQTEPAVDASMHDGHEHHHHHRPDAGHHHRHHDEPPSRAVEASADVVEYTLATQTLNHFTASLSPRMQQQPLHRPAGRVVCASLGRKSNPDQKREDEVNRNKLLWATGLCFAFFLVELVAGLWAGSLAILSDAFHLLSDIAGFGISIAALHFARRPATSRHSFGFARIEILGAIMSTFLIWFLTFYLILEAVERIRNPTPIDAPVMFGTALIGVFVNIALGLTLHSEHGHSHGGSSGHGHSHGHSGHGHGHGHSHGRSPHFDDDCESAPTPVIHHESAPLLDRPRARQENINVRTASLHVLGDLLTSVGVLLSSIVLLLWPEATIVDPLCTFLFSIFVLLTTCQLVANSVGVLMEAAPRGMDVKGLEKALGGVAGVMGVHDLHVWTLTEGTVLLTVHLVMTPGAEGDNVLTAAQEVAQRFGIDQATVQVETSGWALGTDDPRRAAIEGPVVGLGVDAVTDE